MLDGLRRAQPMLAAATWADPVVDGDAVKVSGTLPPGSVLGTATLTFHFDGDGRIAQLQQALTPGAPPPPTAVALDGAIAAAVNGALDNGTPIIAAYVDRQRAAPAVVAGYHPGVQLRPGRPLDPRPRGRPRPRPPRTRPGSASSTATPPPAPFLQIQGRGRVDDDPHVRDVVFDNSPEREQSIDPERLGVAVIVDVDRVQGRLPDGPVNMSRDAH